MINIPFSPPYIDDEVKQEVLSTLDSGWITSGPKVLALEKLVAEKTALSHVVCCNSATSGLLLMLHWYGIGKGDEVIIPAYTYAATALVVIHAGATPVMVDVADDFNIDIEKISGKITDKTKAIIPVDIAGWPCDYDKIFDLVNSDNIKTRFSPANDKQKQLGRIMVLSDAAHSIGAFYNNIPSGKCADFTVFSFHAVKNVTTAEGGAVCIHVPDDLFDHGKIYKELKLLSLNGQTKDAFTKNQGGGWRYDIVMAGYKINMPDICAAIGLAQLKKYHQVILPARKKVFDTYSAAFKAYTWAQLPPLDNASKTSSYHLYALRILNITEAQRDEMIDQIAQHGVAVNVHFQPLPLLTLFKAQGYNISDYPVAFDNYSREISLPIYPELDLIKINYIVATIAEAYQTVVEFNP